MQKYLLQVFKNTIYLLHNNQVKPQIKFVVYLFFLNFYHHYLCW